MQLVQGREDFAADLLPDLIGDEFTAVEILLHRQAQAGPPAT